MNFITHLVNMNSELKEIVGSILCLTMIFAFAYCLLVLGSVLGLN